MIIKSFANTNVGMIRTENQDAFGHSPENNLFFVCDGMGGGVAGDFASKYAVDMILKSYPSIKGKDVYDICGNNFSKFSENIIKPIACIKLANRALHNLTVKYPKLAGMGTTCTAVWFEKQTKLLHIYNVGDSRVYRIRNGVIKLLTEDHSKIQELLNSGKMTQADVKMAEIQSMITRALGTAPTVRVDYKAEIVRQGDIYVLCSDGLNGELADFTIRDIVSLNKPNVNSIANELITAANNAGGKDNTTVIALYAQEEIDDDSIVTPDVFQNEIIISESENSNQLSIEDSLIKKVSKKVTIPVPKLAKKKNLWKNPLVIAILLVLVCVGCLSVYVSLSQQKEEKNIEDLTGNISGMNISVRTLEKSKLDELNFAPDRISKMQIVQDCMRNLEECTVPLSNVEVMIENNNQNLYMGLSSINPLEVKLPKGKYVVTLTYPDYKVLNDKFELKESVNVILENSGSLTDTLFIMLPEN